MRSVIMIFKSTKLRFHLDFFRNYRRYIIEEEEDNKRMWITSYKNSIIVDAYSSFFFSEQK